MGSVTMGEICALISLAVWAWLMFRSTAAIRAEMEQLESVAVVNPQPSVLPDFIAQPARPTTPTAAPPASPEDECMDTPTVKNPVPLSDAMTSGLVPDGAPKAADISGTTPGTYRRHEPLSSLPYRTVVVFLSGNAESTERIWAALKQDPVLPPGIRMVCVTRDPKVDSPRSVRLRLPRRVVVIQSSQAWDDYQVSESPTAVFVDGGYITGTQFLYGWGDVDLLVARHLEAVAQGEYRPDLNDEITRAGIMPAEGLPLVEAIRSPEPKQTSED